LTVTSFPGFRTRFARKTASTGLLWIVLIFTVSLLASFGLQYAQVRIMQWVGQETMYDLRKEIFERLQRLPMTFFDRSPVGRLVTRATTDVDALNDLFASGVVAMLNDFVMLFGLAGLLFYLHQVLGARRAFSPAADGPAHLFFPQFCARRQPPHSHGDRKNQRLPAGAHQRDGHRPAL
jgi:ABC-type multidrug transport system fused ATPase/permease subunit